MAKLAAFGEAMLRLTPPRHYRLEQSSTLEARVAGGEYNVAVALARLGVDTAFVTRLPDNPLGRMMVNRCREHGVDSSDCTWSKQDRAGVYFIEQGAAPRASSVLYDRRESAMSRIEPGEINWPRIFAQCQWFHFTGVTPALSHSAAETCEEALCEAQDAGASVCFDLNYRAKLWSEAQARETLSPLMQYVQHFVGSRDAVSAIFDIHGDDKSVMEKLRDVFGFQSVLFNQRRDLQYRMQRISAAALYNGAFYESPSFEMEVVDRVGGGDSFTAGYLYGLINHDIQRGLSIGAAYSALKHTHPGDLNWSTLHDAERLLSNNDALRIER